MSLDKIFSMLNAVNNVDKKNLFEEISDSIKDIASQQKNNNEQSANKVKKMANTSRYLIKKENLSHLPGLKIDSITTVSELCDQITSNLSNVKPSIRKFVLTDIVTPNGLNKKDFQDMDVDNLIEFIRNECVLDSTNFSNKNGSSVSNTDKKNESSCSAESCTIESFAQIQSYVTNEVINKLQLLDESLFDVNKNFELSEDSVITMQDNYLLKIEPDFKIEVNKVILIEANNSNVLAVGRLEKKAENVYFMIFDNLALINHEAFKNCKETKNSIDQARLVVFDVKKIPYACLTDVEYKRFNVEKQRPLCIDFGTSNTTAGCFGILNNKEDSSEIVHFLDVSSTPNNPNALLLPTIVFVYDCSDDKNVNYLFGYEARKQIEDNHYESKADVFYELKRWMTSPDDDIEIKDNNNHKATVKKIDIIKAYLDYVIHKSEQYFKTSFKYLHFSAPVKLKEYFNEVLKKAYEGDYVVLSAEDSIDEGVAIVYNKIMQLYYGVNPNNYQNVLKNNDIENNSNNDKKILIMDCGGGTTDLASCHYKFENKTECTEITIDAKFENGNPNFGGNNITYRIMQLLKIKIAAKYCPDKIDYEGNAIKLINKSENEILSLVEESIKDQENYDSDKCNHEIYKNFLENYEKAEGIIPTKFVNNPNPELNYKGILQNIKRNFFYLWRQAENIKIKFYEEEKVQLDLDNGNKDSYITINNENYYLHIIKEGNKLEEIRKPFENIKIDINEIRRIIAPDLYSLLVGIFGKLTDDKESDKVDSYDYYKLSGQSCKISLFMDLIKEYIPGRKLRPAIHEVTENFFNKNYPQKTSSEGLKLDCIEGCIAYTKDKLRPNRKVIITPQPPQYIYNVFVDRDYSSSEEFLFNCQSPKEIRYILTKEETRELPIVIKSKDSISERKFIFRLKKLNLDNPQLCNTESLVELITKKGSVGDDSVITFIEEVKEKIQNESNHINVIAVIPSKLNYGIYILQLNVHNSDSQISFYNVEFKYENFEDSSKIFFNGER